MPTATASAAVLPHGIIHRAATDPIDGINDYTIPILPFKRPPSKDDFQQIRRRRKPPESDQDQPKPGTPNGDGLVDEYA